MIKRGIIVLTLLCGIIVSTLGYCQNSDQKEKIKRVTGTVADIDWVAGKIVVRTTDFGTPDEITFVVSENTEVTKGAAAIGFGDINLSNTVTVEYVNNSLAGLKAVHITVKG